MLLSRLPSNLLTLASNHCLLQGRDAMYDNFGTCGVDPRNIAQRIMDIRSVLAKEFVADLSNIAEENALLMRESIAESFSLNLDATAVHPFE